MIKKALLALAITGTMAMAHAGVNLAVDENFEAPDSKLKIDLIKSLTNRGWVVDNKSSPAGPLSWFQGDPVSSTFTAQSGAENSYISANFQSGVEGGILNNFLETPEFNTSAGVIVKFFLNAGVDSTYFDQIDFGFITDGVFTSALNSVLTVAAGTWTEYTVTMDYTPGSSRFAFDYTGLGSNANVIGIDSLTVQVPEPSSIAILGAGIMGLVAARRRKNKQA